MHGIVYAGLAALVGRDIEGERPTSGNIGSIRPGSRREIDLIEAGRELIRHVIIGEKILFQQGAAYRYGIDADPG